MQKHIPLRDINTRSTSNSHLDKSLSTSAAKENVRRSAEALTTYKYTQTLLKILAATDIYILANMREQFYKYQWTLQRKTLWMRPSSLKLSFVKDAQKLKEKVRNWFQIQSYTFTGVYCKEKVG